MITPEKEEKIIQRCLIITGLSELRGRYYIQDKKKEGDKITPRIHKTMLELKNLLFSVIIENERDIWVE